MDNIYNPNWQQCLVLFVILVFGTAVQAEQACYGGNEARSAPDSRYINNHDGTISDIKTRLMWQRCPVGHLGAACEGTATKFKGWDEALQYPASVNSGGGFAGHTDWRLPNVKELVSLLEYSCYDPSLNFTMFPSDEMHFWTSTAPSKSPSRMMIINFKEAVSYTGERDNANSSGDYVRMVRTDD